MHSQTDSDKKKSENGLYIQVWLYIHKRALDPQGCKHLLSWVSGHFIFKDRGLIM
jgi:hypothetical protein